MQYIFPISLPEKPLLDNNLTFNYFLTNMLAYVICPVLVLILLRSPVSRMALGLKVQNAKQTALYAFFGLVFIVPIFMLSHAFFGYRWITEYTTTGLVLWILLVTILSVFAQTLFYIGILFIKYSDQENKLVLAIISILTTHSFILSSNLGIVTNIIYSATKIIVASKTHDIYGSVLISSALNLMDLATQILRP
ncbi:hypothetical protein KEJ17_08190 [Candidatus Bathyarchaeota archaeon]|nr:hypothetical protein [Candidatus Bathyarchaeota archaeon]